MKSNSCVLRASAPVSAGLLAQMTMGLYYGQVNHLLAHGCTFEANKMHSDMALMLQYLLQGIRANNAEK